MTVRQQLVDALETRLDGVATFTGRVHVWRATAVDPSDLPALILRDTEDNMPPEGIGGGRRDHELAVEIGMFFSGGTSTEAARQAVADVVAAIGTDETWGGLAYETRLNSANMDLEAADRLYCAAELTLTILYRSGLWTL